MTTPRQPTLMSEEELSEFSVHMQNLNFDASDHRACFSVTHAGDQIPQLQLISGRLQWSRRDKSLEVINRMLYQGLLDVAQPLGEGTVITPKRVDPSAAPPQHTPVTYMSPDEETQFNEALETVQRHQQKGHCQFDSWVDPNRNLYTRTRVTDEAPEDDVSMISEALRIVSSRLHEGSAVRVPMPEGGVMLMARWDLRQPAKAAA